MPHKLTNAEVSEFLSAHDYMLHNTRGDHEHYKHAANGRQASVYGGGKPHQKCSMKNLKHLERQTGFTKADTIISVRC